MQQGCFDTYAVTYDDHFTFSPVGRAQRRLVHSYLLKLRPGNRSVLEVTCGTGEDAVFLARHFSTVTATDQSAEMIRQCEAKLSGMQNARFLTCSVQELDAKLEGRYDLVFSNFGGLNCLNEQELSRFAASCARLGAKDLVLVIMGRRTWWERLYFTLKNDRQKAARRQKREGVTVMMNGAGLTTWYYSPEEVAALCSAHYQPLKVMPVGFFIPPSYLNPFFSRRPFLFSVLQKLERTAGPFASLADYADHYLIHLQRK